MSDLVCAGCLATGEEPLPSLLPAGWLTVIFRSNIGQHEHSICAECIDAMAALFTQRKANVALRQKPS